MGLARGVSYVIIIYWIAWGIINVRLGPEANPYGLTGYYLGIIGLCVGCFFALKALKIFR